MSWLSSGLAEFWLEELGSAVRSYVGRGKVSLFSQTINLTTHRTFAKFLSVLTTLCMLGLKFLILFCTLSFYERFRVITR